MDKLKLAHDYALKLMGRSSITIDEVVRLSFDLADAMQAEAEERNKAEVAQKRKEMREMLNAPNTFVEREGQHFDDVADIQKPYTSPEALCEVDWRVAPQDTTGWKMKEDKAYWIDSDGWIIDDAPSFGFTGSHIVERPDGF